MNLFKRATATIALVTLVSGVFSTGVSANSSTEIEAANALAAAGYIVDHSDNTGAYNLNQNVLRQEIAAVARGIAGLDKKASCDNSFADVSATTPNTWACYSVEALLDADLIASNENFKPENNISKAEAIGMMVKASYADEYSYDAGNSASWQAQVVEFAASKGIVANFTNYDTAATRGFVFEAGNNAILASQETAETCDEVSQLLGLCGEETTEETTEEETTEETVVISGDNVLVAELSADTAEWAEIADDATGVSVLSFDVTAGSEDVSVSGIELERIGFGEANAKEVVVYTEEGRASKDKGFNSDDIASVSFSPAVVVKAGETRTLTVKVNVDASVTEGEFAVKVNDITASSTVDAASIVSNYFETKDVLAANLDFDFVGVNNSVKTGEEQAEVAKFTLENIGTSSTTTDVDVYVSSITLEETGTIDHVDYLENLTLTLDGKVISTVEMIEDKFVTFNFDAALIEDGKKETFTVKADVMGDAAKNIIFDLDNISDISATSSKYNSVKVTEVAGEETVSVDAGELTIYAIDAESDEVRQDKDNLILGQIRVVNVAGKNLELKDLGVQLTTIANVDAVLENVEVEVNGTSYDLPLSGSSNTVMTAEETDLGINLAQGTTILTIRADTLDNLNAGESITLDLVNVDTNSDNANDNFLVEETEDDVVVTDVTPSSLSFKKVDVVHSAATLANVPLADVTVVKGAESLVAIQFEVEAGKASAITTDEMKAAFAVSAYNSSTESYKDFISETSLYKGSVSESNLLDRISGSKIDSTGKATFDGFEVEIAADTTETFIVTISTSDTSVVEGRTITATVTAADIALEDDENDSFTITTPASISDKVVTVTGKGTLALTADADSEANEDAKTILAGTEAVVYSVDAKATNEAVNAETVVFTLNSELKEVVSSAKLYLDDTVVATATNSDVVDSGDVAATLTFNTNWVLTAKSAGTDGNSITLEIVDGTTEGVAVTWTDIVVTADISNTPSTISSLIAAEADANALVTVTNPTTLAVAAQDSLTGWTDKSEITFDNISSLDFGTDTAELSLAIVSNTIGYEKVGAAVTDTKVTDVDLQDLEGVDSGETVSNISHTASAAANFSVASTVLTVSVIETLSNGTAKIEITADSGENNNTSNGNDLITTLDEIAFTSNGNGTDDFYKVYEEGEAIPANFVALTHTDNDLSWTTFTDSVIIHIVPEGIKDDTYNLSVNKDGVTYNTVNTVYMSNILELGSKTY